MRELYTDGFRSCASSSNIVKLRTDEITIHISKVKYYRQLHIFVARPYITQQIGTPMFLPESQQLTQHDFLT